MSFVSKEGIILLLFFLLFVEAKCTISKLFYLFFNSSIKCLNVWQITIMLTCTTFTRFFFFVISCVKNDVQMLISVHLH